MNLQLPNWSVNMKRSGSVMKWISGWIFDINRDESRMNLFTSKLIDEEPLPFSFWFYPIHHNKLKPIKPPPSLAAPRTCSSSRNMAGIKTLMLKKQHDKEEKQAAHQASVSSTNSSQFRSSEMTTASDFTTASGQSTSSQASKNSNFHTRNMAVQGYLSGGKWFRIVSWWVVDVGLR